MIVLDTSILIDSLCGQRRSATALRKAFEEGERILLPALVLYEWLRGPRLDTEIARQEALFPSEAVVTFGVREAAVSAQLYRTLRRPRGQEVDLAIAASALVRDAQLWTLNRSDFRDIPKLRLR